MVFAAVALSSLAACAHLSARPLTTANWETHFQPDARCTVRVVHGAATSAAGTGAIVVRAAAFAPNRRLDGIRLSLTPLASPEQSLTYRDNSPRTSVIHEFGPLAPGPHVLRIVRIGFSARSDTVLARAGVTDTIDVNLEEFTVGDDNPYNCRPRRFRRVGESACVTVADNGGLAVEQAQSIADLEAHGRLHLPKRSTVLIRVVDDERVCERAARAYAGARSPPRRMIVADGGGFFVVSDPYEPLWAGEWHLWQVYDRRWRLMDNILGP
jgi:hypothetical protein